MSRETGGTEQFERRERSLWMQVIYEALTVALLGFPLKISLTDDQVLDSTWKKHVFKGL